MVSAAPALDSRPAAEDRPFAQAAPWLAGLLGYAVVLLAPQVLNDGDSYWHVAAGGWMLDHARILRSDVFSFTFNGRPWHTHEWLAEALMALAFRTAGWSGVVLLYGAAAGSAMAILARQLRRSLDGLTLAVALLLAFACMTPGLLARPHLLALPLLAAWTAGLLRAREAERAPPLALAALMTPWANLHGGYFLGLALIGPFALEALLAAPAGRRLACARAWALFGVASLAASLVTPFGLSGLIFPIKLLGLSSLAGVTEWKPADFSRIGPLEISLIATLFVLLSRGVSIAPLRLALLLLLLHMSLQHSRHQMLLAVIGPMLIAQPLGRALKRVPAPGPPVPAPCLRLRRRWTRLGARRRRCGPGPRQRPPRLAHRAPGRAQFADHRPAARAGGAAADAGPQRLRHGRLSDLRRRAALHRRAHGHVRRRLHQRLSARRAARPRDPGRADRPLGRALDAAEPAGPADPGDGPPPRLATAVRRPLRRDPRP